MRNSLLLSFLCGFLLLVLVAAQVSSTEPTATTASVADVTPTTAKTDTAAASASSETVAPTSKPVGTASSASSQSPSATTKRTSTGGSGGGSGTTSTSNTGATNPPDVLLRVPELHVGRIELDVDNLQAEVNLAAEVANLVSINAGVQVGVKKVNITIAEVNAELQLEIRLGHLVDIVNRTLKSLNLNPLLINVLNDVTDLVDSVVGAVDGLLGSILQGNTKLNFIIDNLGNIIQEVVGDAGSLVSSIVGNFNQNMTFTGATKDLGKGLTQKTYEYSPLGALVNIVTNTLGQVVQAVVVKGGAGGGSGGGSSSTTVLASTSVPATTSPPAATTTAA